MKKLVYIFLMFIIAFSACDPNEEIYDELDDLKKPFSGTVDYIFTADDYATASEAALEDATAANEDYAEDIEDMEAFNEYFTAEDYVGSVLSELYPEYNLGSRATVTYNNFLGGLEYLYGFGDAESYELVTADYDAMGEEYGEPGYYNNFSSSIDPDDYLPDFLLTKYPSASENDIVMITYAYYSGGVEDRDGYYFFDGSEWSRSEAYVLTADDYDSMGAPGNYNNFSSSEAPEDYLPTFLKLKYPYAQSGDSKVIVYKYYSGSTSTRADEYHFDGTVWTEYDAIVEVTNQFVHDGTEWLFDPTIVFTMGTSDFQTIVEYVENEISADYLDSYGTAEFYYGASYYYNNFSIGDGYFEETEFATWDEAVREAIGEILLPAKYPDAKLQVNGVDLYYKAIFETYTNGARVNYAMKFQVTKAGPDPEFTYDEEYGLQVAD